MLLTPVPPAVVFIIVPTTKVLKPATATAFVLVVLLDSTREEGASPGQETRGAGEETDGAHQDPPQAQGVRRGHDPEPVWPTPPESEHSLHPSISDDN